jgi:hypothetical protein
MKPDLSPRVFKFRVMRGEEIVGQFSNLELAVASARDRRNIPVVLDVSVNPPRIVFKNGMRVDQEEGK